MNAEHRIDFSKDITFNHDFFNDLIKHSRLVNNFFSGQYSIYKEILTKSNKWTLPLNLVTHYFIRDNGDLSISFYNGLYDTNTKVKSDVKKFINLQLSSQSTPIFYQNIIHMDIVPESVKENLELLSLSRDLDKKIPTKIIENLFQRTVEQLESFNNFFRKNEIKSEFLSDEGWYVVYLKFLELSSQINHNFMITHDGEHYNKSMFVGMIISQKYFNTKLIEFFSKEPSLIFHLCQDLSELLELENGVHSILPTINVKISINDNDKENITRIIKILSESILDFQNL